jgi:catechol 2,3-dioxygenase-like lactoylglutathione lyase family enzyme
MQLKLMSVMVDDQRKAEKFYTEILGFVKKKDMPMGEFSFLTVVSPEGPDDVELLLEPNVHPAAQVFQKAMRESGIPLAAFAVADTQKEYERLIGLGVEFKSNPKVMGPTILAVFDDSCGNYIQIFQAP